MVNGKSSLSTGLKKEEADWRKGRASTLLRLGKFDEAYKHFARAAGAYTGNLNTARMLERFGRDDDAIKYYEAARQIEPNSTLALKRLGELYKRTGRVDPAQAADNPLIGVSGAVAAR